MLNYFREVRAEMRHVNWPSRKVTLIYTGVVIGVSIGTAAYLGLLDYIFSFLIQAAVHH